MVNKKNKILCAAIFSLVQCTLPLGKFYAHSLPYPQEQTSGPWSADAATRWSNASTAKSTKYPMHPLEWPIIFFQQVISPQDGAVCRFQPSCSAYGRKAISRFGTIKGILLTIDRLVRDNPYTPPGEDQLPEH